MPAAQAPDLRDALERAQDDGLPHVIPDGTIIPADRCKGPALSAKGEVIDLWYSGKAHTHGGNVQAVIAPDGFPLWVSDALQRSPGRRGGHGPSRPQPTAWTGRRHERPVVSGMLARRTRGFTVRLASGGGTGWGHGQPPSRIGATIASVTTTCAGAQTSQPM